MDGFHFGSGSKLVKSCFSFSLAGKKILIASLTTSLRSLLPLSDTAGIYKEKN